MYILSGGDKCQEGKSKEPTESAEGGGLFYVGWPRSSFLKMWLLNRDLNEVRKRGTWVPRGEHFRQREQRECKGQRWELPGVYKELRGLLGYSDRAGSGRRGL